MAEGKCAFIGHSKECLETFEKAGFPCPAVYNPADHYVFVLAVERERESESKREREREILY